MVDTWRGWQYVMSMEVSRYRCGYCGHGVASDKGWCISATVFKIFLCPNCNQPSFFDGNKQIPGVLFGNSVENTPGQVQALYEEARRCTSISAYTGAVMLCRKLLMHIAVAKGAGEGRNFLDYINYLADKGYVPPDGKDWVDHIREKGNEANHEIKLMNKADAEDLIHFSEMLLKFIYEFPARIPKKEPPKT